MRVLDLDLDFFLDDVAYNRWGANRLPDGEIDPWEEDAERELLEHR